MDPAFLDLDSTMDLSSSSSTISTSTTSKEKDKDLQNKLILEVQSFMLLYDKSNKDYKNLAKRNEAWRKIGIILGMSAGESRKMWEKLRNCFRHYYSLEKKGMPSGSGSAKPVTWEFYESMSFLKPCMDFKSTIGSYEKSTAIFFSEEEASELSTMFTQEKEPPAKKQKTDNVDQLVGVVTQLIDMETTKNDDEESGFYKYLEHLARQKISSSKRVEFQAKCLSLVLEYADK